MSVKIGRPPKENPRNISLHLSFTKSETQFIKECADELNITRTDAIIKGIELLKSAIKK